jgi:hypothetical protein
MSVKIKQSSNRGVDKLFPDTRQSRVANSKEFLLAKSENNSGSSEEESVRGTKNTRQAGK